MRYIMMMVLLVMSMPALAQSLPVAQTVSKGFSARNITIEGFVLGDKAQFVNLFKPYKNKYLSLSDIDTLQGQIEKIYEHAGYGGMVAIKNHFSKKSLTFTVALVE